MKSWTRKRSQIMHELSLCQNLIAQVNQIALAHHAQVVDKVYLQIGPLSGVEPALLQSAFSIASAGGFADGAQLIIQHMPVRVQCKRCHAQTETQANRLLCGECGHWQTVLVSGDELVLERVELKVEH
jgi:hydrogenase nickel incorporation protein HypA/HybF